MANIPSVITYKLPELAEFPSNIAKWKVDTNRAVFLIHDMQKYFIRSFDDEIKIKLIRNIYLIKNWCIENNIPVAYSAQPGGMNEEQRGLLKDFWGAGMKIAAEDREVIDEISPTSGDWQFEKWRYSAFHRSNLLEKIKENKRDQLLITGVYAHVGVLATAVESFTNDLETFVVGDAIADFSHSHHRLTMEYAAERCAVVIPTQEILS
ncbi:isochorismatase family protein [Paraburkholderia sp.]|uniref:isochorismatase family protein n=1 Tax=Paraburkholderia sp. TaxID=1926495 RepID=UPI0025E8A8FC|nr:isochorismatase family protein [Paraburkholderia sp.]